MISRRVLLSIATSIGLSLAGGIAPGAATMLHAQTAPRLLEIAGRSGANPSLTARGEFVVLTWSAASTNAMDVYAAVSRNGGRTFGAPVVVNREAGQARVSGEQPPRAAIVARGSGTPEIVVVWTVKTGSDWQLLQARSRDGGATFAAATPVPGSDAKGARGWEAVDVDANGVARVLWLDHRDAASLMTHQHDANAPKPDPTERAALSKLYLAKLDGSTAQAITSSVCYCCKTALTHVGSRVYAAWRQVYPGSIRDIAFSVARDGRTFTAPVKVSDDRWQIDGCPDNGPTMAVDATQRVHVVWPTAENSTNAAGSASGSAPGAQQLALFYATSADARRFSARERLPIGGPASHPSMALVGETPFVVWDEIVNGERRLAAAKRAGARFTPVALPGSGARLYPAVVSVPGAAVVAWVQQDGRTSAIGVARTTP